MKTKCNKCHNPLWIYSFKVKNKDKLNFLEFLWEKGCLFAVFALLCSLFYTGVNRAVFTQKYVIQNKLQSTGTEYSSSGLSFYLKETKVWTKNYLNILVECKYSSFRNVVHY